MKYVTMTKTCRWAARLLPVVLAALVPLSGQAQKLTVEKTTVDVGKTGYEQPVTAVFEFHNKKVRHLRIEAVKPDCQCTVVDFPRGEIAVGERFQIRMTYDAKQLGHFDKQAAVVSNGSSKPLYIRMKGVVLADYQDVSATYPIEMGDLLLDKNELEFDDVNKGDHPTQVLNIYNNGTRVYEPNLMHLPSYLTSTMTPERLAPGHGGQLAVTLNSANLHDYGLTQSSVFLAAFAGDKVNPDREITVSTVVLPSFADMTDSQRLHAAKIQLSRESLDIRFDGKKKKTEVIDITNNGHSELNISSLQMFTRGLKISLGKRRLQPGQSTKLKITALRDDLQKVRTRPRVLMITNDPAKPKVTITINAK